jgi:tetratricopeptide (TPR) repeat protein
MKLAVMQEQHDPLLALDKQNYTPEDLPKQIENWLQQSLEVRERESTRPYQTAQCYMLLGKLYLMESEYLQAKVQLKRALIRLLDLQKSEKVLYETIVDVYYNLGSVDYKLQDYQESVDHYREAIVMLQERQGDSYWTNVIAGNLGLAYLRAGLTERGQGLLEKAKEAIRAVNGAQHYDFLFLTSQEQLIASKIPI